jgi:hypothetical protein
MAETPEADACRQDRDETQALIDAFDGSAQVRNLARLNLVRGMGFGLRGRWATARVMYAAARAALEMEG